MNSPETMTKHDFSGATKGGITLIATAQNLDAKELRRCLAYDESSPSGLRWRISPSNNIKPGDVAGARGAKGYYTVRTQSRAYKAHHLVLILHDQWPEEGQQCDHVDRNPGNNKIANLRWVTPSQNNRNSSYSNRSGFRFVSLKADSKQRPCMARYRHPEDRCEVYVGRFSNPYEAHLAAIAHRLEHWWKP